MNIIMIMIDSLRQDHLGCYGNEWIETPNIDALAKESVVFENAYPEGMPTVPVRTSLLTGNKTLNNRYWQPLTPEDMTMPEILDEYDYLNVMITDSYQIFKPGMNFHRGFHSWDFIRGNECDAYITKPHNRDLKEYFKLPEQMGNRYIRGMDQYFRNTADRQGPEDYFPAKVVNKACTWLEDNHEHHEKFFLYIDIFDPHEPFDPAPPWDTKYLDPNYKGPKILHPKPGDADWLEQDEIDFIRAMYAGEVSMVDQWIGKLMETVEKLQLLDDTLIVLLADHGVPLAEHGTFLKVNDNLYNELVRIPLMFRMPGGAGAGKRVDALVEMPDIMPTIMDMIGLQNSFELMNGSSFLPIIKGEKEKIHDHVVLGMFGSQDRCLRTKDYSYIKRYTRPESELYDLINDPLEQHNLTNKMPEKVKEMDEALPKQYGIRVQKEHWFEVKYDVPGLAEGHFPRFANYKK